MRSNAPAMRKAGPTISTGWSRLQPDATQAQTLGTAELAMSNWLPRSSTCPLRYRGPRQDRGEVGPEWQRIQRVVLGKALRVLPETELLKPLSDLMHRGSAPGIIGPHRPASASLA